MKEKLPVHLAIIMDGNGRWARKRMRNRVFGHRRGISVVKKVVEHSVRRGIRYLTLYTFSSENWRRPEKEVGALMALLKEYLRKETNWLIEMDIKLHVIGDRSKLPKDVAAVVDEVEQKTAQCSSMVLNLALSYGGKDEIVRAVRTMIARDGVTSPADVSEDAIARCLDTAGQPDPDLLIRTSGEYRLSNFLPWQTAYTEFYFTDTLWPDFTVDELEEAFKNFSSRERRFGKV